jgi:hypothetical protein
MSSENWEMFTKFSSEKSDTTSVSCGYMRG